jgi:adenine-specific DNA-methyltransferase
MNKKQRLELTWIGKDDRPRIEPRILLEDEANSYLADQRVTEHDLFDNRLIFGDNLLALKALEQELTEKIKAIIIDPRYNTGSALEHFEDGIEHSLWLSLMRDRLQILHRLLSNDGSIWITIDDNEAHYLKVLCDEIFGRSNFVTTICWEKIYTLKNSAKHFSAMHDYILVYSKNIEKFSIYPLDRGEKQNAGFKNPDNDVRGPWLDSAMHGRNFYSKGSYVVRSPSGKEFKPPPGRYWTVSDENFRILDSENRIWWGANGNNAPRKKTFLTDVRQGVVPGTIWSYKEAGQNAEAKEEIKKLFADTTEVFITPKPERLLRRILTISTRRGDLVLDSFAGTGTTGAVAHKMGRRWIMVELGEHCHSHIIPRLKKVIDGEDPGGITETVDWKGGGGFRYYRLAPSLLNKDRWGNWVISPAYNSAMLAEAVCKLMGFTYMPSEEHYWMHGFSSERDFIYVTTQSLTAAQLAAISEEVGDERSLLICCNAFRADPDRFPNLSLRKIPQAVLRKCEWGRDDYSLIVAALQVGKPEEGPEDEAAPAKAISRKKAAAHPDLFAEAPGK